MTAEGNAPTAQIAQRWASNKEDLRSVATALRQGDLGLVNSGDEVTLRRVRLAAQAMDLEAVIDEDDSLWLSFLSRGLTAARAVCRVVTMLPRRPVTPEGTGVLISPRLLLTNHHVVPEPQRAVGMGAQLGYEHDDEGRELPCEERPLAPETFFFTVPTSDLDFTVVALGGNPPRSTVCVPLIEQGGKVLKGEALNVVHHPGGERKRVSIRQNRLVSEDEFWLRYTSDTRRGSSGAPVFNDQWEMVALHHGGVPALDEEGHRITRTGEPWNRSMGEDAALYRWNEGARVSRIVRRFREADLPDGQWALLAEALDEGAHA
ncbi:serine protease [Streptomyces sp. NPDC006997]|uniref:trypsin-like serine peptidase n=1 Tax=Streptomyces sp. NPDC006997 TaxID=3155356 RepID=UPI0033D388D8